jgi:hypothetical protein
MNTVLFRLEQLQKMRQNQCGQPPNDGTFVLIKQLRVIDFPERIIMSLRNKVERKILIGCRLIIN